MIIIFLWHHNIFQIKRKANSLHKLVACEFPSKITFIFAFLFVLAFVWFVPTFTFCSFSTPKQCRNVQAFKFRFIFVSVALRDNIHNGETAVNRVIRTLSHGTATTSVELFLLWMFLLISMTFILRWSYCCWCTTWNLYYLSLDWLC